MDVNSMKVRVGHRKGKLSKRDFHTGRLSHVIRRSRKGNFVLNVVKLLVRTAVPQQMKIVTYVKKQ